MRTGFAGPFLNALAAAGLVVTLPTQTALAVAVTNTEPAKNRRPRDQPDGDRARLVAAQDNAAGQLALGMGEGHKATDATLERNVSERAQELRRPTHPA